jgi:acyl carrier protein
VSTETLAGRLRAFIVSDLLIDGEDARLSDNGDLFEEGLLDSMALMRLIAHLEEGYGITVSDDELVPENFGTITALARFVVSRQGVGP